MKTYNHKTIENKSLAGSIPFIVKDFGRGLKSCGEFLKQSLLYAIRKRKGFVKTIEVDPNYGKYHFDGHRNCNISMSPSESKKINEICPKCRQKMTIGVLSRVEELADRPSGYIPENAVPFISLIPLSEIISALLKSSVSSRKVWKEYYTLIKNFDNEFNVLLNAGKKEILKFTDEKIADAIIKNREGKIKFKPGFDGVYGELVFDETLKEKEISETQQAKTKKSENPQKGLGDFI